MDHISLINAVHDKLNKKFKDSGQRTYILDSEDSPIKVKYFTPTGSTPLDVAIANRPNGGIPAGKITVLEGLNSAGKSLVLATVLANNQRNGGISVMFDNEFAVDKSFYEAIGLDMKTFIYSNIEFIEDMLAATEDIITTIRKEDPEVPIVIGWDSIAGAKSKSQGKSDYDKDGYATEKAIILSQKIPKLIPLLATHNVTVIATQQLRANMNAMAFGEKYVPASGGMALNFYASVRVRLSQIGKIQTDIGGTKLVVGTKTMAQVIKNRLGPPYRKSEFEIYFDSGIDDSKSCLDILKFYKTIGGAGAWYSWREHPEELEGMVDFTTKFQQKQWREWMANRQFYKAIASLISRNSIMKYKGYMGNENNELIRPDEDDALDVEHEGKEADLLLD